MFVVVQAREIEVELKTAANVRGSASKRDRGGVEDCSKCSW